MADTDVLVSELDSASAINTNDLLLMTQPDGEAQTGYSSRKGTVLQAATKMLKGIEFATDLPHFDNKTVLGALEELSTGKANTSGEYNGLISGQANALKPSARLENETPYLFRPSYANGYGYETLRGGTVAFNQKCQIAEGALSENVATKTYNDGVWTFTATDLNSDSVGWYAEYSVKANHVCFIAVDVNPTNSVVMKLGMMDRTLFNVSGGAYTRIETLRKQDVDARPVCYAMLSGQGFNSFSFSCKNVNFIDLTQMLGTTIAEYIYSLEQANTGAGVAYFRALFSADYYPYNAGGLLSVKTSKKINTGKNITDIGDNTIAGAGYVIGGFPVAINADNVVLPVGDYVFSFSVQNATYPCACQLIWYRNGVEVGNTVESISASGITSIAFTASGEFDSFAMFCNSSSGGAFTNFNLNIGSTPLAYEPYVSHEYPLDDIELRGILKLDGSNNLYYDGDTYESNGSVTRKYGIVDLGELDYSLLSNTSTRQAWSTSGLVGLIKPPTSGNDIYNAISSEFSAVSYNATWLPSTFSSLTATGDQVVFCVEPNAYVDGNAFKTAMNGVYLVYELATPTTETADAFTNPMLVDGNGTEEFVDGRTVEMPVGHETIYVDDNDATKLESLPDISNDGNGTYLVNQINGQLSLAKYGIPNPPTTDGSYRLEVTVTDGVPAYTWEVIS